MPKILIHSGRARVAGKVVRGGHEGDDGSGGLEQALAGAPPHLQHADDAAVAQALKHDAHALAALAQLVLRPGRGERLDAALDALLAPAAGPALGEPALLLLLLRLQRLQFLRRCRCGLRGGALADALADPLAQPRAEDDGCGDIGRGGSSLGRGDGTGNSGGGGVGARGGVQLLLDDGQDADEVEVAAFGLHPSPAHVDDAGLEDVAGLVAVAADAARDAGGQQLEHSGRQARFLVVDADGVQPPRGRVDVAGDGVGAQDVGGEGVELRRGVAQEVGQGDGREGVGVGVVGRVREDHGGRVYARLMGSTSSQKR